MRCFWWRGIERVGGGGSGGIVRGLRGGVMDRERERS